jgi:hypothetical protein
MHRIYAIIGAISLSLFSYGQYKGYSPLESAGVKHFRADPGGNGGGATWRSGSTSIGHSGGSWSHTIFHK